MRYFKVTKYNDSIDDYLSISVKDINDNIVTYRLYGSELPLHILFTSLIESTYITILPLSKLMDYYKQYVKN